MTLLNRIAVAAAVIVLAVTAAGCASEPGDERPTPTATQSAGSSLEAADLAAKCLAEEGWDVTMAADGGFTFKAPPGQHEAFFEALDACNEKLGFNDAQGPPVDHELAVVEYAAVVSYRECLIVNGRSVPELPTFQKYEEDLINNGIIYDFSSAAGLAEDDPVRLDCDDPGFTWGMKSDTRNQ